MRGILKSLLLRRNGAATKKGDSNENSRHNIAYHHDAGQWSAGPNSQFRPVCIKDDTNLKDGFVEVKFKPISGKIDQAGGLVWRARDSNNYYIARANALEDNVTIYHTINGRRTEKKRTKMKVASNQWHTLRVDFQDNHFTVTFDGKKAIEWDDDTFKEAGKVGVWTKADSVTLFDDFSYGSK